MSQMKLPSPSDAMLELSSLLIEIIKQQCEKQQCINFHEYMKLALYHPQYGYYQNNLPKLGQQGDFITAPTLSPVFSYCLANQCQQVLRKITKPSILEFGAGNGTLATDLITRLAELNCDFEYYYILELSPTLKTQQAHHLKENAPNHYHRVQWITELPTDFKGVILANEVLDAMPCQRFCINEKGHFEEQYVGIQDDNLYTFFDAISTPFLTAQIDVLNLVDYKPYESEIQLSLNGWINSVAASLSEGLVLLIDYGFPQKEFYHPERNQGTLMCHYQHHAHPDPLWWPGLQDITCHVDFSRVATAGIAQNLSLQGFTTQGAFLIGCGLADIVTDLQQRLSPQDWYNCSQAIKCLTLPHEMGELFKVIALTKGINFPLIGFQFQDLKCKVDTPYDS